MADINNQLDQTTEKAKALENEVQKLEKELEIIPNAVLNSDVALSNYFDSTSSQIKEFKNQLSSVDKNTDFNNLNEQLSSIKRNISEIMSESSKIAINAFDTSDSQSLKSELNAIIRSFKEVDINGTKIKDTIASINPELGAVIDKAIYTTDILETLMKFVTMTDLKKTTDEIDLAKGINLGVGKNLEEIEKARKLVEEQKKYIAETYPNGSNGLSDVKSRIATDEFIGPESELDAYNRELAVLNELEKNLIQTTREFEEAQRKAKELLESNNIGDSMSKFKGYFDMYNVATTTFHKLGQFDGIRDYLSNPFYTTENNTTQIKKDFEEILPKPNSVEIKAPETQLNTLIKEEDALRNIADRQAELLNDSKYITAETRSRIDSEERLNTLLAQRQSFDASQLEMANKIASIRNVNEENKILDLGKTKDLNEYNAYMTSVEQGIKEIQQIRENILKAQNTINNPNMGANPFMNIISPTDVERFEKLQQLFNSGLKINAEGADFNYIKQLGMYLDSTREIAQKFKAELNPEVGARQSIFAELYSIENEGKEFNANNIDVKQQYLERAKAIAQLTIELEKLKSNKDNILPNLDVKKAQDFNRLIDLLTTRLDTFNRKQEEVKSKMNLFGIDIPNTENIRTSKNLDYINSISHKETINGKEKIIYDYKELAGEIENIIRLFDQEASAAERARQAEERDAQKQQEEEIKKSESAYENLRNKVSEVTNSIKHAIGNIIGVIRTVNNVLHKVGSTIISVFNGAIHTVQRIIQLFGNLGDRIGLTHRQNNLLKGSFTELKSAIDLVAGAFNKIYNNQFIQQGKKLLGSIQTLNMLLGTQLTQSTIEWANNMEKAFGLSAADLISNLREVTAVMYGLGMTSQDVQVGARNLESVGMVLSSISGLQFDVVMNKIQSGMKGMTQAIDDLGLSVRETQMDAYLKKLKAQGGEFANISTSFSKLNEQQRVYVRYAAIMDQFVTKEAYSMENYAKSLRTTTGSLGVLSSQLAGLKSTLGTLALGLFSKVLQPLIYIVYYIRQLIVQLGEFLGIKMKLDANLNGGGTVDTSPVEDETEALDEMSKAASKAKGSLDELDHISTMSSSSGSDAGTGSDFDYSSLLAGYNFADELAKYDADFIEECRQKLIQMLKDAELSISEFIRKQTGRLIDWDELENNLKQIKDNIKATFMGLIQVAENAFKIIGGLLWSIGDDLNFSSLFEKFTKNIANTVSTINLILERIAPYIQQFYDKYLSKYVIKFGEWLDGKLDVWSKKLHEITMYWIQLTPEQMEGKVDELGTKFENLLTTLKEISIIFKTLFGKDTEADNMFMNENASENMKKLQKMAEKLNEAFTALGDIIKKVFHDLADLNGDGVVDSYDLGEALDGITKALGKVATWLSENKEEISKLLENAAKTVGKLAKAKFDIIMTLLEFITDIEGIINGVLNAVQTLIDLVAKHPVLSMITAIELQVAGKVIKTAMTAALWKEILGIGAGGAGASAGVGGALGTALSSITPVIAITATITALAWELSTLKDQIKEFSKEVDNAFELTYKTAKGEFGTITDSTAHDKYSFLPEYDRNITIGDIEAWAYDVRAALEKVYGQDITKEQSEKALQAFRYNLAAQGNLTEEQIDNLMEQLETKYDELGKINWYDKFQHGGLFNLWESNGSKENQAGIEKLIRQMDELGYSAEDVKNATDGMLDNLQSDVDNTNTSLQSFSDEFDSMNSNVTSNINDITDNFGNLEQSTSTSFEGLKESSAQASNSMTVDLSSISSGFEGLGTTISGQCNMAANGLGNLITRFSELFKLNVADKLKEITKLNFSNLKDIGIGEKLSNIVSTGSTGSTGLKTKIVKGFRGYANGGMPKTGSLFMANENGDTELVGNFGGYPGVANQGMIIKAMESAMYNAVTQALRANNNNSGQTTIEVCKGGVFVGDQSGIRKLANMLNNTNSTSRTNIANTGFSMS